MIVRCGRCQSELEVAGAGEFLCPACGTRNVVRGAEPAAASPFGFPDLGATPQQSAADDAAAGVRWIRCPTCAYRFAVGEVQTVTCPTCAAALRVDEQGAALAE